MKRAQWTLHLPRLRCPNCGKTIDQDFRGRLRFKKKRGKGDKEGRECSPCEASGDEKGDGPDDLHAA
jgi:hypothetical protein